MREKGLHRSRKRKLEECVLKLGDPAIVLARLDHSQQYFRKEVGQSRYRALGAEPNTRGKMSFVTDQDEKIIMSFEEILRVGPIASGVFDAFDHIGKRFPQPADKADRQRNLGYRGNVVENDISRTLPNPFEYLREPAVEALVGYVLEIKGRREEHPAAIPIEHQPRLLRGIPGRCRHDAAQDLPAQGDPRSQ